MAPFFKMINLGLINPVWRTYIYQLFEKYFNRQMNLMKSYFDQLDELMEKMRETNQRPIGSKPNARQPRLVMEADDVTSDEKTRKRTEEAASDRVMCGNSSSAQVDHDPTMCQTSFSDDATEPPALPCCRDDALVHKGAEAPNPCLSPVETRKLTSAGSLLPAGTAATATSTIFHQLPLWNFCPTEEIDFSLIQYATYISSFWKIKVLERK